MSLAFRLSPSIDDTASPAEEFRADVLRGLAHGEKQIPCKYFYDEAGSQLFERICELPEYYPTRTELGILREYAPEMAAMIGSGCLLIEYGSGSSSKTRLLLEHLTDPAGYVPVDIAREQLQESSLTLARDYPWLTVHPLCADFTRRLAIPFDAHEHRRVVYFPGSTVGNLTPGEAIDLLRRTARLCGSGGGLLLGVDLKKEPRILTDAYNDRAGVTAAFNANVLVRINRGLDANFCLDQFWHHAFYNPTESRIEMHLVSGQEQQVRVADQLFSFAEGESIRTEYSYKYALRDLHHLAAASGFRIARVWTDQQNYFSVQFWTVHNGDYEPLDGHA